MVAGLLVKISRVPFSFDRCGGLRVVKLIELVRIVHVELLSNNECYDLPWRYIKLCFQFYIEMAIFLIVWP